MPASFPSGSPSSSPRDWLPEHSTEGRFTSEKLAAALADVCAATGLDPRGATLLRLTNNAVFRLARTPAVVRIIASVALRYRVTKVVRVASWLAERDFPVVRLWPGAPQPVEAGGHLATVWRWVPGAGRAARPAELARLLRRLHALPPPPFEVPLWRPLDDVRRRLSDAEDLSDSDREFLQQRCERVQQELDELRLPGDERLLHGDAHLGNVIAGRDGPVLCDFDSTSIGPAAADLVPLAVGILRFGDSATVYRQFVRGYGVDVMRLPGFEVLRDVRELKLITGVLPAIRGNPGFRDELQRRLADVRRGDRTARWHRFH